MDYKTKYLKYKTKYLNLSRKIQTGGYLNEEQQKQLIKKIQKRINTVGFRFHKSPIPGREIFQLIPYFQKNTNNDGDNEWTKIEKIGTDDIISIFDILNVIGEVSQTINLSELLNVKINFREIYETYTPINLEFRIMPLDLTNNNKYFDYLTSNLYTVTQYNLPVVNLPQSVQNLKKFLDENRTQIIVREPEQITSLSPIDIINLHIIIKDDFPDEYKTVFDENGHYRPNFFAVKPVVIKRKHNSIDDNNESDI
jgi:hypothetical protein